MRYGPRSQLARLDCTSSRRSTVMCALPRAIAVTTVYQRDSSSKRPRLSVVSAARAPTRRRMSEDAHGLQGFAPCGRRLRRPWTPCPPPGQRHSCQQADACWLFAKPSVKDRGLTEGHSISALCPLPDRERSDEKKGHRFLKAVPHGFADGPAPQQLTAPCRKYTDRQHHPIEQGTYRCFS